jgi:hypothetical protein
MNMNGEYIRIWKEAVVTCFKELFRSMPGETEEKPQNQNSW